MNEQKHWSLLPPAPETSLLKEWKELVAICNSKIEGANSINPKTSREVFRVDRGTDKSDLAFLGFKEESFDKDLLLEIRKEPDNINDVYIICPLLQDTGVQFGVKSYRIVTREKQDKKQTPYKTRTNVLETSQIRRLTNILQTRIL